MNRIGCCFHVSSSLLLYLILAGVGMTILFSACTPVGPDYQPPQSDLPESWSVSPAGTADKNTVAALGHWWRLFNDPLLDLLIDRAVTTNTEVRIAVARVRQARARYRLSTAAAAPTLDVAGVVSSSRRSENGGGSNAGTTQDLFQGGFDAGWELDVFGGVRRGTEAAGARLAAAGENHRDVLISLAAEVGRNYMDLRYSQQRLVTARENLDAQKQTLKLARGRWKAGLGNQLDVAQAETQLAQIQVQLPPLEERVAQVMYTLAFLLGLPPLALVDELSGETALSVPHIPLPSTLPSDLLRRRPDIRQAERKLAAATADIGVATADLFPRFSLTGLLGLQSVNLSDLFTQSSRYWTIGPSVQWSLFAGGRIWANIELSEALLEEAEVVYERTLLSALGEVERALLAMTREEETRRHLVEAVASGERAVELARGRYRAGLTGFLDVLQGERALFQSQDQLIQSEQRLSMELISLFKALGGGWELNKGQLEEDTAEEEELATNPQSLEKTGDGDER